MPDAAIPIFQTVNQKGEATLEVEAVIKALGLKLTEGKFGGNKPFNRVEWLEEITGTKREQVFGGETNTGHHRLELAAFDAFGPTLSIDGTNGALQYANGNQLIDLFGEGGPTVAASKFLQLPSGFENWVCNFGRTTFKWPGGAETVAVVISHGLGTGPTIALGTTSSRDVVVGAGGFTATTITYEMRDRGESPAIGTETTLNWFVIG